MYVFKASIFNIHGGRYMEVNMSHWICRFSYRSATCYGHAAFMQAYFADYLSILTFIVSFGLVSGGHRNRLVAFRCLRKRRPPWKPPWNQITEILHFWYLKNVNKGIEIIDLSWVIFTTKTMPSPGAGDVNDMVCDVTDGSQPFDFQKTYWSFIKEMIAKQEDQIRLKTKTIKENNRSINLLAY
ncbi:unnamed protein product, partial [Arabidopsis halleri]